MNNPDPLVKLQLLLKQMTLQIVASSETITKIQAEVKLQLRPADTPLEQNERAFLKELLGECDRMNELLTAILK